MNLRSRLVRHTSLTAATALAAVALIASPVAAQAADPGESGPELAGTGYTDISTLDVVDWVDPEPGQAPPPRHPTAGLTPLTDRIACGGRKDFYRVINQGGGTTCFQRAGTLHLTSVLFPVEYVCPGNNAGQVNYYPGIGLGGYRWSSLRDGHSNFDLCWRFDTPSTTDIADVRIK